MKTNHNDNILENHNNILSNNINRMSSIKVPINEKKHSVNLSIKSKKIIVNDDSDYESDPDSDKDTNDIKSDDLELGPQHIEVDEDDDKDGDDGKKEPPKKKHERNTLYLDDDRPVTASGALIYKNIKNKLYLLVSDNRNKYEDIGGKIDPEDATIQDAAGREIEEETNGMIKKKDIIDRLKKTTQYIYMPKSKYVVYLVEATENEQKLKKEDFGTKEIHDGFDRTIGWISREELCKPNVIKFKLNWRLKSKALFDKLSDIENKLKYKKNLFKKTSKTNNPNDKKTKK